jgi:hypothetical protein
MKNRIASILLLAAFGYVFSSCNKDDEKPNKIGLLTAHTWTLNKVEVNGQDVTDDMDDCDTDNELTFKADGTFTEATGLLKCEESEVNGNGVWKFKSNESVINIHENGGDALDWIIVELTSTVFKISIVDDNTEFAMTLSAK